MKVNKFRVGYGIRIMEHDENGLPIFSEQNLSKLEPFYRAIGALVVIAFESQGILMLHHKESDKVPKGGQWGPLAETSKCSCTEKSELLVETTAETIYRALYEELSVARPQELELTVADHDYPYVGVRWPTRQNDLSRNALPALGIGVYAQIRSGETVKSLTGIFQESAEIDAVEIMDPGKIGRLKHELRPGFSNLLNQLSTSGLMNEIKQKKLSLPGSRFMHNGLDIRL